MIDSSDSECNEEVVLNRRRESKGKRSPPKKGKDKPDENQPLTKKDLEDQVSDLLKLHKELEAKCCPNLKKVVDALASVRVSCLASLSAPCAIPALTHNAGATRGPYPKG